MDGLKRLKPPAHQNETYSFVLRKPLCRSSTDARTRPGDQNCIHDIQRNKKARLAPGLSFD